MVAFGLFFVNHIIYSRETLEAALCLSDPFDGDEHNACFFMPLVEIYRHETVDYFNWYCFVLAVRLNEMMHSDSVHYILMSVHCCLMLKKENKFQA